MKPSTGGNDGSTRSDVKRYGVGLLFSIGLTAVAFGLAMGGTSMPVWLLMSGIYGAALIQMLVHLRFFLHLDTSPAGRGNLLSLVFTALILFLFIGGSLWIMFNLDYRMM